MSHADWHPFVIGHRGARGLAPENTLPAFDLAARMGLPAAELDVHLTADGALAVIHDHTVDRTTGGTGRVDRMALADLRRLNAAATWAGRCDPAPIPTLDEVFAAFGRRFLWEVEIKVDAETDVRGVVRATAACVDRHGIGARVTITSFAPGALAIAREIAPGLRRGIIASAEPFAALDHGEKLGCRQIGIHQSVLDPAVADRVRAAGMQLTGWQGNSAEEMERLATARVDGFSSDRPDIALGWLREKGIDPAHPEEWPSVEV